jgi:protocatechuate 3,4-dioxygenase beta subunit
VTHVTGRVLGLDGKPIANATVEIWQCDANGRYIHPDDTGGRPRDKAAANEPGEQLCRRR